MIYPQWFIVFAVVFAITARDCLLFERSSKVLTGACVIARLDCELNLMLLFPGSCMLIST
jgi:hypothetical protein